MGVLTIVLEKVENLRDEDAFGKSDPYVKFELEQDNYMFDKNYGKKESTKKENELSPVYNETFTFEDMPSLKNMVLKVRVMDDDIGRDDQIGYCKIKLDELGLSETPQEIERVIDKKQGKNKGSVCHPCKFLCGCCCACVKSLFINKATVHLKLSYTE